MFSSCGNRTINVIYDILPSFNNVMFTLAIYYNRTIRIVDSFLSSESAPKFFEFGVVLFLCPYWALPPYIEEGVAFRSPQPLMFLHKARNKLWIHSWRLSIYGSSPSIYTLLLEKPYFFNHLSFIPLAFPAHPVLCFSRDLWAIYLFRKASKFNVFPW